MHKELGSWVTLPCHIHLGGELKIIKIEYMHSSPSKVNDHIRISKIISSIISVPNDQTHDHQCLTDNSIVSQASKSKQSSTTKTRENKSKLSLSLKAYDLYIFLPLWQQVTKKFIENA